MIMINQLYTDASQDKYRDKYSVIYIMDQSADYFLD